jgi:hypothetical protein
MEILGRIQSIVDAKKVLIEVLGPIERDAVYTVCQLVKSSEGVEVYLPKGELRAVLSQPGNLYLFEVFVKSTQVSMPYLRPATVSGLGGLLTLRDTEASLARSNRFSAKLDSDLATIKPDQVIKEGDLVVK